MESVSYIRSLAKRLPVAIVGMLAFIALPFGGTAARFALLAQDVSGMR